MSQRAESTPIIELVDAMLEFTAPITQALDHMMRSPGEPEIDEVVEVLKTLLRDVLEPMGTMLSPHDLRTATAVIEASVPMICESLMLVPHGPRAAHHSSSRKRRGTRRSLTVRGAARSGDPISVTIDPPTCRATIRDGLVTLNRWTPGAVRPRSRAGGLPHDHRRARRPPGRGRRADRHARPAHAVGRRRRGRDPALGADRRLPPRLAPAPRRRRSTRWRRSASPRVDCPACGARWEDGSDSFWERVRADGWFPGRCPACGGSLPEWSVTDNPRGTPCLRPTPTSPPLTERFDRALLLATDHHRRQLRKGTTIPYVSHLLGVTSLVLEMGGDETEAIGALLHDAVEDGGGPPMLERIRDEFGDDVARIVLANSDSDSEPKPPWRQRKTEYLAAIAHKQPDELRVSLADKLHNARAILLDYRTVGEELWYRFRRGAGDAIRWYYRELYEAFDARRDALGPRRDPGARGARPHDRRDRSPVRSGRRGATPVAWVSTPTSTSAAFSPLATAATRPACASGGTSWSSTSTTASTASSTPRTRAGSTTTSTSSPSR